MQRNCPVYFSLGISLNTAEIGEANLIPYPSGFLDGCGGVMVTS